MISMFGVSNQQKPARCQGLTVKYIANTYNSASGTDTADLTLALMTGQIDQVQSAYIDAYDCTAPVTLTCNITGQRIVVPSGQQIWTPILSPNPPIFSIACSASSPNSTFFFCNFAVPFGNTLSNTSAFNAQILSYFHSLPTVLPATSGQLWNNGGVISLS